ncbi:nuclear transport factor 2 family protein [Burkholderia guangdongensis]|uniref:nuclear transport factor 2 family protein n=1 Tax=Burkholderia guangdongensis TaxID=1792500 RepID=UPI0015CE8AE5|nr:nuclear transport factor 2 family protein [Burkholderia guangdongensis]
MSDVFLDALHASIVDIERWLSGADSAPAALDALIEQFSPDYTMILTDGRAIDRDGLRALFRHIAGAKPGLRIALSEVRVLASTGTHVTLTYLESQHASTGALPARRATAVFARDADGAVRWLHLQETFCTA